MCFYGRFNEICTRKRANNLQIAGLRAQTGRVVKVLIALRAGANVTIKNKYMRSSCLSSIRRTQSKIYICLYIYIGLSLYIDVYVYQNLFFGPTGPYFFSFSLVYRLPHAFWFYWRLINFFPCQSIILGLFVHEKAYTIHTHLKSICQNINGDKRNHRIRSSLLFSFFFFCWVVSQKHTLICHI